MLIAWFVSREPKSNRSGVSAIAQQLTNNAIGH
jgi:hypothetical protein